MVDKRPIAKRLCDEQLLPGISAVKCNVIQDLASPARSRYCEFGLRLLGSEQPKTQHSRYPRNPPRKCRHINSHRFWETSTYWAKMQAKIIVNYFTLYTRPTGTSESSVEDVEVVGLLDEFGVEVEIEVETAVCFRLVNLLGHKQVSRVVVSL